MEYRYEMHCHSAECSACARTSAREMVHKYKNAGYSGLVLTDHFLLGNSAVDKKLPWDEKMRCYYNAYLEAKDEAEKLDFDVIFGIEHHYGAGKEVLCYGIDLDFLLNNPDMLSISLDEFSRRAHERGILLIQAHPFRVRDYIDISVTPRLDLIDGIEVYNAGNKTQGNIQAFHLANEFGGIITSGSDFHGWPGEPANRAGISLPYRVHNGEELVAALKKGDHRLIVNFETLDGVTEDLF